MNGRDGRYDGGDYEDADWLLSQLGSGRRPDLEGRPTLPSATEPVMPEPYAAPAPVEPPPPASRGRRRTEESLDWFSLAEPAEEPDAATRALPVVGEPLRQQAPEPAPAVQPAPAWNQPAWNQPAHPAPPHVPGAPAASERLTSVEPPVGAPVPPAFGGAPAMPVVPPAPVVPPGPVTPPASFALTWGDQAMDSEAGLRAAFRQLSEPVDQARHDEPPHWDAPEPARRPEEPTADRSAFAPPSAAPQPFTPAPQPGGGFPPARSDFDDELWSALTEDAGTPRDDAGWNDGDDWRDRFGGNDGYDDRADGAGADASGFAPELFADGGGYDDGRGYDDRSGYDGRSGDDGRSGYGDRSGYDDRGYDQRSGYDDRRYDERSGYDGRGYDQRSGYDDRSAGYDDRFGYDEPGQDAAGHAGGDGYDDAAGEAFPPTWGRSEHADGADDVRWYADEVAERERRRGEDPRDDATSDRWAPDADAGERAPWDRGESSPMAQELAQTGYFWNLTPDPTGRDPKAEPDDDAPGPRRRTGDDAARDDQPFGVDTYAAVGRFGAPETEAGDADEYADDPFARFAQDEVEDRRAPWQEDDDAAPWEQNQTRAPWEQQDDARAPWEQEDDARAPWEQQDDARAPWEQDDRRAPWADDRGGQDAPGFDDRPGTGRAAEPGTETGDGLSALFGGAGFGATGPMGVVSGAAAGRTAVPPAGRPASRDDEYGRDPFGRDDRDPFGRDPFGNDPFGRGADVRDDRYGDDRYGDDRGGRPAARPASDDDDRGGRSPVTVLAWIAGALAAVLLVVGGIALVSRMTAGGGASEQVASGSEDTVDLPEPTAVQAPGVYPWSQLFGGECLEPFQDAWADEYTVVDCATPHSAQLVLRGEVSTDEAAAFPGEAEVQAQVAQLCAAEGVIDPAAVGDVTDLQMQFSYPVDEAQWTSGERTFYCFVNRSGGEPLAVSVQGPGPQA